MGLGGPRTRPGCGRTEQIPHRDEIGLLGGVPGQRPHHCRDITCGQGSSRTPEDWAARRGSHGDTWHTSPTTGRPQDEKTGSASAPGNRDGRDRRSVTIGSQDDAQCCEQAAEGQGERSEKHEHSSYNWSTTAGASRCRTLIQTYPPNGRRHLTETDHRCSLSTRILGSAGKGAKADTPAHPRFPPGTAAPGTLDSDTLITAGPPRDREDAEHPEVCMICAPCG